MTPSVARPVPASEHPLLATARQWAPRLAARSDELEAARRLPADLARQLALDGFFRMTLPERYGGLELHPVQLLEVVEALAQGDGSAAWCVMIGGATPVTTAWLSEDAARTVFSAPDTITGGVAAPLGRAERVEGGYRVSGRWPWASGSQNCHWLVGGALVTEGGKPRQLAPGVPEVRHLFMPAGEVVLHDTWQASGLCGTGSGDMEVRDLFVPEAHSLSFFTEKPRVPGPVYAFPFGLLAMGLPGVALGLARRAMDELMALAHQKRLPPHGKPLATRARVQEAVAEAHVTVRAARAGLVETAHATYEAAARGELTVRTRAELRLAITHTSRACARAVDLMYEAAGGSAVFRTSPLQRCFRDVHVLTQHAMVAPPTLELTGALLLGLEADTATL